MTETRRLSPRHSAAEEDFIKEMTRQRLVDWCHRTLQGALPNIQDDAEMIYLEYAQTKGWVSKDPKGFKILSPGWKAAAAFLRR